MSQAAYEVVWPTHPCDNPAGPIPAEAATDPAFPIYVPKSNKRMKNYTDPTMSPLIDSVKQMHYINATEMSAAESLAYLYYGVQHMPLTFYYDLARHLWDEVRHCLMGIRRLKQLGFATEDFKYFQVMPGKDIAAEWFPDMYASLTMVAEPCSFLKKRKAAQSFWEFGDTLSAVQVEFDMADERMHVDFGKTWGPELYKQINQMVTAKELSERARTRRLTQMDVPASEIKQVTKNFPAFCGFTTSELNYSNY
ncbi:hypothetical protein D3C73_1136140 [compost metagenome]